MENKQASAALTFNKDMGDVCSDAFREYHARRIRLVTPQSPDFNGYIFDAGLISDISTELLGNIFPINVYSDEYVNSCERKENLDIYNECGVPQFVRYRFYSQNDILTHEKLKKEMDKMGHNLDPVRIDTFNPSEPYTIRRREPMAVLNQIFASSDADDKVNKLIRQQVKTSTGVSTVGLPSTILAAKHFGVLAKRQEKHIASSALVNYLNIIRSKFMPIDYDETGIKRFESNRRMLSWSRHSQPSVEPGVLSYLERITRK